MVLMNNKENNEYNSSNNNNFYTNNKWYSCTLKINVYPMIITIYSMNRVT